eukprot:TRINITY_DN940_c0_g3_i1.p1 TRINITY_DN940_c0_g3~~TRINITY_DN940_c0_g3_i1.p1  ORF type:complete len:792 (-),score=144.31 TRINITY_DN940_c0_g3_i1:57-2432(-)
MKRHLLCLPKCLSLLVRRCTGPHIWALPTACSTWYAASPERGSCSQQRTNMGGLPIHLAAQQGHIECIQVMLNAAFKCSTLQEDDDEELSSDSESDDLDSDEDSDSRRVKMKHHKQGRRVHNEIVLLKYKDKEGNTPLLHACINAKLDAVEFLLMHGSSIRETNKTGITCLLYAADKGNLEMVKFLLSKGASVEERDKYQNTPLLLAAGSNYTESMAIIQYLMEQGASITEKNKFGRTSLLLATWSNSLEKIKFFLAHGSDINEKDGENTALLWAARHGDVEMVRYLVACGASLKDKDPYGNTPLLLATFGGKLEMVKFLLDNGSSLLEANNSMCTSLCWAAEKGFLDIAKFLISRGASIKERDLYGNTPLLYATLGGQLDCVEYFLSVGSRIDEKNTIGCTALTWACQKGKLYIVKYLLDHGAHLLELDTLKNTCLMYACLEGGKETVEYLLNHPTYGKKLAIDHKNSESVNAMMFACRGGNVKVVNLLLQRGAQINDQDTHGNTPFYYAAMYGHTPVLKLLIKKGADMGYKDSFGSSPWLLALINRKKEATEFLLSLGVWPEIDISPFSVQPDRLELLFEVLCEGAEFDKCKVHSFTMTVYTEASFDMLIKLLRVNKRLTSLKLLVGDKVVPQEKHEALATTLHTDNSTLTSLIFEPVCPHETVVQSIAASLQEHRESKINIAKAAIQMLCAARIILLRPDLNSILGELPSEIHEHIVMCAAPSGYLTLQEAHTVMMFASRFDPSLPSNTRSRQYFLERCIYSVRYWGDVLPEQQLLETSASASEKAEA